MSEEKKIIVDEDWKSRVAAEKEEQRKQAEAATAPGGPSVGAAAAAREQGEGAPLPPASFSLLVTTFATEAMIGLGQLPHPATQQFHRDPQQARYAIDMLDVLADKTKGNLTPAEQTFLDDVLHQLRLAFVAVTSQPAAEEAASPPPSGS